jgi:hypothetical protein
VFLLKRIFSKIKRIFVFIINIDKINERFDEIQIKLDQSKINEGIVLSTLNLNVGKTDLRDYEFKIFSQWGEDGIIQHLTRVIEIRNKTFIEFGVEDFLESNCRFLLMKDELPSVFRLPTHRHYAANFFSC